MNFTFWWAHSSNKPLLLSQLFYTVLFTLFSTLSLSAQQQDSVSTSNRFFVGIGISNTGYPVMGKPKYEYFGGITPFVNVNFGYKATKRTTIQVGLGYGANKMDGYGIRYVASDTIYDEHNSQHVRAIVMPATLKFTPFYPHKRLQLYINASIVPVIGCIKARATESYKNETTLLYDEESPTFDLVATAGITINYKINKRLDAYIDGILLYKNFNFQRPALPGRYLENKSIGIGVNYNLNLK